MYTILEILTLPVGVHRHSSIKVKWKSSHSNYDAALLFLPTLLFSSNHISILAQLFKMVIMFQKN